MMWSSSARSILKGWFWAPAPAAPYPDIDRTRSSAITTGAILDGGAPNEGGQGPRSYMDVSMSVKRTSSRAKSVRKEPGEDGEGGRGGGGEGFSNLLSTS